MRTALTLFLSLAVSNLLLACIPTTNTYFHPTADRGKVIGDSCRGHVGPPKVMQFQHDGIMIETSIRQEEKSEKAVGIYIWFSKSNTSISKIWLPSNQFVVQIDKDKRPLHLDKIEDGRKELPLKDALFFEGYRGAWYLEFKMEAPDVKKFTLYFPTMLINDQEVTFPPIKWTLKKDEFQFDHLVLNC